ncbi:MAG TPA: transglutaminase domain-containing protein [Tepidisphaeraceae bacterium]|jgi:transglutaminase-like putative cysteine protease|nr:transglutaminase domain-containing protein [Tepidisphaeraceae bacterium]
MRSKTFLATGIFIMTNITFFTPAAVVVNEIPNATAASLAFTSNDPIVVQARALVAQGRYADADALSRQPGGDQTARQEMSEIIRRARQDYTLNDAQLLEKIQKSIPDATPADLERWDAAGQLTFKTIDGQRLYFGREPSNLFKLSDEARTRAHKPKSLADDATSKWKLVDHLAKVVADAERTGDEFVDPIHHRIVYSLSITPADGGAKPGSLLRVWLPYPQEYRQQRNVKMISMSPEGGFIAPTAVDGNPIKGAPQRTVYFEKKISDPKHEETFKIEFEYDSFAYYPKLDDAKVQPLPADFDQSYLAERPPHIVFSPEIKNAVVQAVGDETNPLIKARKIFHWIGSQVRYAFEDEYCTIPSYAQKIIMCKKGDCGIQATLFITMCRAAGVPARWQSGWESKVVGNSQHDWAEFYVAPWGWLPADQSYGLQPSTDPKVREFYIGHQDAYRMIVNLDWGQPLQPPVKSLRSDPSDFQRGEVEIDGKNIYYDKWDYNIEYHRS